MLIFIVFALLACVVCIGSRGVQGSGEAVVINIDGTVDGGMLQVVERGYSYAIEHNASVVLVINSYGGYVYSADKISDIIVGSGIQCYAFIPPNGRAVSAAAMIAIACGNIYMGDGSVIGDAIPIPRDEKTVSYVAARFRSLAERMFGKGDPRVDIVERFVTEGLTLTAKEAIKHDIAQHANNLEEILDANNLTLVKTFSRNPLDWIISIISDPLVSSLALLIGFYLILAEILITGFQGYVIAGALLIAMALYGMSVIPPDMLILAILLSGAILLVAEYFTPGFGVFGISGLILLGIGMYLLLTKVPIHILSSLVIAVTVSLAVFGGFMGFIVFKASQTIRMKRPGVQERLRGQIGIAKTDLRPDSPGVVYVAGEEWSAYSREGLIPRGSKVKVVEVKGLFLIVTRVEEEA